MPMRVSESSPSPASESSSVGSMRFLRVALAVALLLVASHRGTSPLLEVAADTPANCSLGDVIGHWSILVSAPGDQTIDCRTVAPTTASVGLTLSAPNLAKDDQGNVGHWTLVYNQGFEAFIAGQVYFAFSGYNATTSLCDRTQIGWVHTDEGKDWRCFSATRDAQQEVEEEDAERERSTIVPAAATEPMSPLLKLKSRIHRDGARLLPASPLAGPEHGEARRVQSYQNILDFGAIANTNTDAAAEANSAAIQQAFAAATEQTLRLNAEKGDFWAAVHAFSAASYDSEGKPSAMPSSSPLSYAPSQVVLVPSDSVFYIAYTPIRNASSVLLAINGSLIVNGNETRWQQLAPPGSYGALHFIDSDGVTIQGKPQVYAEDADAAVASSLQEELLSDAHRVRGWNSGAAAAASRRQSGSPLPTSAVDVDGAGYSWWWTVLLGPLDHRPHMFYFERCSQTVLVSLYIQNAPMFHVLIEDGRDVFVKNVTIYVDVNQQKAMTRQAIELHMIDQDDERLLRTEEQLDSALALPVFPLNTDGIDPSVSNLWMEDFYIENFDDAVAVKPANGENLLTSCAENMLVRNGAVKYSVGLTIGSVPPHFANNCVNNITFASIAMTTPFKAIYIKTNPGTNGTGTIANITYDRITVDTPLWYPIWIGPQQQKQPANGTDTGCSFLYPLNQTCATQPLVTISAITLSNIESTGGLTLPGVLLCDPTNPCTGMTFANVSNTGPFLVAKEYVCKNAQGVQANAQPDLACFAPTTNGGEEQPLEMTVEEAAAMIDLDEAAAAAGNRNLLGLKSTTNKKQQQRLKSKIVLTEDEFSAVAALPTVQSKPSEQQQQQQSVGDRVYRTNPAFLAAVNRAQSMFRVKAYPELFDGVPLKALERKRGGTADLRSVLPKDAKEKVDQQDLHKKKIGVPSAFDWRNVSGVNYVSPVRDQGLCGSCYAFSSAGMMESRVRIASNNTLQPIFSPQEVVSCSQYSQGCEGGFPYLVAGKYGRDFGLVEEACYPYIGWDSACTPDPQPGCNPRRWRTNEYSYIGGYYGASTPERMQEEMLANGPISVALMAYDDLLSYAGGVYTHQFTKDLKDELNPFKLVNHAVLMVGWGETDDATPIPYWIVKNSWGTSWGESGYFRILRGSSEAGGECAIESITVSAIPILPQ